MSKNCQISYKFNQYIKQYINKNNRIALALSGGSDSMALFYLLQQYVQINNKKLYIFTLDHQLRRNSRQDIQYIHQWLDPYQKYIAKHDLNK